MNERIHELRKTLKLSQRVFGEKLGLSESAVSNMESGRYNVTDTVFKLMCQNFNANDDWLRHGSGNMFNAVPTEELDRLAERYNLPAMAKRIVKAFVELEPEEMEAVMQKIKKIAAEDAEAAPVEDDNQVTRINGLTEEEEHELVRRRHADAKRGMPSSMISGNVNHA